MDEEDYYDEDFHEEEYHDEHKESDNRQRYKDIKSTQDSFR